MGNPDPHRRRPLRLGGTAQAQDQCNHSTESLIGAGTTDAVRMLLSLPVIVNVNVPTLTGLIPDKGAVVSAVGPVPVAVSEHAAFAADSVLLRATWRIAKISSGRTGSAV
jgi:hypothetical protein